MTKFAASTGVSVEKTKAEIERTVRRYGADSFISGWSETRAMVQFRCKDRVIKFLVQMPSRTDRQFTHGKVNQYRGESVRADRAADALWEQACRSRWRSLALIVKAKLEAVDSGIVEFDQEFFGNIVMPDGATAYEAARDNLALAYKTGKVQPLLPDYSRPS
jgi:hypothetical protein